MNYEPGKLVTENEKTSKNVIVENKIETLLTPKTSNEVISETTLKKAFKEVWESRQNLISEQWARLTDQIGYWKILFTSLTAGGIGVKWEVANDPVKSTFMYWGQWVIWKDVNKNGGWPISFTGADKKVWLFKFKGGKYAGQPASNIIMESKFINSNFNLGDWGKSSGGGPQLNKLMQSKPKAVSTAPACKTVDGKPLAANQIPAVAAQIFKDLAHAFDGGGTYEDEAVSAYKRITCKTILDAVNAKVAARGMKSGTFGNGSPINNVGDWAKDEMSDYDFNQYRQIWANLQKLGYKAPPVDQGMKAAGVVGQVTGLNTLEKGAEAAKQFLDKLTFDDIIEGIRSFLMGAAGGIITTIIEFTGIGKIATSIVWAIVAIYDIYNATIGKVDWGKILMSTIGLVTGGAVGKMLGGFLKPFFGAGGTITNFISKIKTQKWFKNTLGPVINLIQQIATLVAKGVGGAIAWLEKSVIGKILPKGLKSAFGKFVKWLEDMGTKLALALGEGKTGANLAQKQVIQKRAGEKLVKDIGDEVRDVGFEYGGQAIDYATGTDYGSYGAKVRNVGKASEKLGKVTPGGKIDAKTVYGQNTAGVMSNLSLKDRQQLYSQSGSDLAKSQVKGLTSKLYKDVSTVGSGVGQTYDKGVSTYNATTTPTPNYVDDKSQEEKQNNTQPTPNNPRA